MGKKILITGGAGFIGSHLADRLVREGNEVRVFDKLSTGYVDNLKGVLGKIEFQEGDIRDRDAVERAVEGSDIVYHMAAELGVDRVTYRIPPEVTIDVDLNGTRTVLDECLEEGVDVMLFTSTSEAYGHYELKDLPMREDDDFVPDTFYGKAKLDAEEICRRVSEETGMGTVSVRYFNVYGPRQSMNGYAIPHFVDAAVRNMPIKIHGDGSQLRDFTYIDDAVDATMRVCDKKYSKEVFNIGAGIPISIMEVANKIIDLSGSESGIEFVPPRRPTDLHSKYCDNSKIRKMAGWENTTGLEDGLTKTIEYKRRNMG